MEKMFLLLKKSQKFFSDGFFFGENWHPQALELGLDVWQETVFVSVMCLFPASKKTSQIWPITMSL